ncbi:MAG: hypothetical protein H6907_04265 [Hyphomicrobiales bacterium]|nr:hypothetical protein [Hyphomicrobiales bacterium]
MGKERDALIRRLGGVPLADRDLSDDELVREAMATYRRQGRLPPEVAALRATETRATGPAAPPRPPRPPRPPGSGGSDR